DQLGPGRPQPDHDHLRHQRGAVVVVDDAVGAAGGTTCGSWLPDTLRSKCPNLGLIVTRAFGSSFTSQLFSAGVACWRSWLRMLSDTWSKDWVLRRYTMMTCHPNWVCTGSLIAPTGNVFSAWANSVT